MSGASAIADGLARASRQRALLNRIVAAGSAGDDLRSTTWRALQPLRGKGLCQPRRIGDGYRETATPLGIEVCGILATRSSPSTDGSA